MGQEKAVGVDIEEVGRFRSLEAGAAFYEKVFLPGEIEACQKTANAAERFAGRFCAKEALIKAFSALGIMAGHTDFEIGNDERGVPRAELVGALKGKGDGFKVYLSISHARDHAVAMALVERIG